MNYTIFSKRYLIVAMVLSFLVSASSAMEVPVYDFSISPYSQNANDYLSPDSSDYGKSLLSSEYQHSQFKQFYTHYYATDIQGLSPWSRQMVLSVLPLIKKTEFELLDEFNNQDKSADDRHYAENFKEHDQVWWRRIKENMNLPALASIEFNEKNRAIATANTYARALPDSAPDFFHASLPGQGFPFDNLQESAIWAGTPLYVFSQTRDQAWSLVLTPDGYFAWVKTNDIGYVSAGFIHHWQQAAQQNLIAVTQTETSIVDEHGQFQLSTYIGSIFPMIGRNSRQTSILIPVKNSHNQALIKTAIINTDASAIMPLQASPKNLVRILNQLKNRPYGWGGAFFFNDCSQEMKSIFTPFGIWLPRNSSQQAELGSPMDLSKNNVDERINTLKEQGHPLMTIIYIGGHVMLYVGNKEIDHNSTAITYQNVWGMASESRDKRYVIGQSLFFPLLKSYPENSEISSLASKSNFKLVYLDKLDSKTDSPHHFTTRFLEQNNLQNRVLNKEQDRPAQIENE